jgi:hypothetical protein
MRVPILALLVLAGVLGPAQADDLPTVTAKLDAVFEAAWMDAGIEPASVVDDAGYLRRIYLDIAGTLPPPDRIREFLNDRSLDKRAHAVEQLLKTPEYATRWGNYWNALLMGRTIESAAIDQAGFKNWLREQFAQNVSWDKIVTELVTAEGWNTKVRPANAKGHPYDLDERYAPAVNWFLKHWQSLPELSSATSKLFLGVQLQCAQCHDHKTEKWKQEDYRQFTAFFVKTWPRYFDNGQQLGIARIDVNEHLFVPPITKRNEQYLASYKEYVGAKPKLLNGQEVSVWGSRRKELAEWMTAKDNPYFAKAIINRMWGQFLGRGFVEPIDDFRESNPPVLPAALELLAADVAAHDFDLHRLIQVICASRPYQTSCRGAEDSKSAADALWSRYPLKQLEVEVLLESILQGTGATAALGAVSRGNLEMIRTSFARQFVTQISSDDRSEVANFDETIPRALLMLNGSLFCGTTRMTPGLALHDVFAMDDSDRARIEELYLLTLSRLPTEAETAQWLKFLSAEHPVVSTPGPSSDDLKLTGASAVVPSREITEAPAGAEFSELLKSAKSGADFKALYGRMRNNADAGLYVRALREFSAEAPFRVLAQQTGGRTAKEQAYEDLHWALLNCSEFLTNH